MTKIHKRHKRPSVLLAIVVYKTLIAFLLAITSIALLLAVKNYPNINEFANQYLLEGKREVIKFIVIRSLRLNPKSLEASGVVAGLYSVLTAIEAMGLWYEKKWASLLVIGLVGISIPLEILELIKNVSLIKAVIFFVNSAVFFYLIHYFRKEQCSVER